MFREFIHRSCSCFDKTALAQDSRFYRSHLPFFLFSFFFVPLLCEILAGSTLFVCTEDTVAAEPPSDWHKFRYTTHFFPPYSPPFLRPRVLSLSLFLSCIGSGELVVLKNMLRSPTTVVKEKKRRKKNFFIDVQVVVRSFFVELPLCPPKPRYLLRFILRFVPLASSIFFFQTTQKILSFFSEQFHTYA